MKAPVILAAAVLAATAMLAPSSVHAQGPPVESSRLLSFGLGGGVSVPVSDAKDAFKNGVNGQGFVRLNLAALPIRPRLDFTFQKFDRKSVSVTGPAIPNAGTSSVLAGVANIQVPLHRGTIEPYVVVGLGAYNVKSDSASTSTSKTQFGVNGGAGLVVRLGIVSLYLEGRIDNVYSNSGVIDTKTIQVVPVTFGLVY
jgi:hypothetical protein